MGKACRGGWTTYHKKKNCWSRGIESCFHSSGSCFTHSLSLDSEVPQHNVYNEICQEWRKVSICWNGIKIYCLHSLHMQHRLTTLLLLWLLLMMLLILLIYHYVFKKILTNHFYFVAFKCRKANDGDDDMKSGERWPIIAWAMLKRPVVVRAIGDVARRHMGRWGCGPSSYGPRASGPCNDGPLGR